MMDTTATAPRRGIGLGWRIKNRLRHIRRRRTAVQATASAVPHAALAETLLARQDAIIAFDVFDTLVQRTIPPENVKHLALALLLRRLGLAGHDSAELFKARQQIEAELCRGNADLHGELEFRHADMAAALHDTLTMRGIGPLPHVTTFVALLLECELTAERKVLRAIPEAFSAFNTLRATNNEIVLVSDFYLPAPALRDLLAHCGIQTDGIPLFVSADCMASKRSGRLYPIVLQALGAAPGELLMTGDNPHSDVAMAQAAGCAAIQVDAKAQHAYYKRKDIDVANPAKARTAWQSAFGADPGIRNVAASLVLFIERLHAAARQDGVQHLFFLAREGQVLLRLFDAYQDSLGLTVDGRIHGHYLLASRRACYIASLGPLNTEEFELLFRQYRRISLREFLASLRIADNQSAAFATAIGVDLDATEEDFPTSTCFQRLKMLPAFAAAYEELRSSQKANLKDYIASFDVDFTAHPLSLVDVGWKGTIQDFITRALGNETSVFGYYLGLLNAGQQTSAKRGLLFSNVDGITPGFRVFAENRALFEILLHADHGSALSYDRRSDGSIQPQLEDAPGELDYVTRFVAPLTAKVIASAEELIRRRADGAVPEREWERFVLMNHAALVFRPWAPSACWLMQAQHRENFGVFRHSTFGTKNKSSLLARLRWTLGFLCSPRQRLQASFWPTLTLYRQSGKLLARLYGWRQYWAELRLLARAP